MRMFGRWSFLLCLTWVAVWGGLGATAEEGNLLRNADFNSGMQGWQYNQMEGGSGRASARDGVLSVEIANPGRRNWAIEVGQFDLTLEKNRVYEISFEARSRGVQRIEAVTMMVEAPYGMYSGPHYFRLEPEYRRFAYTFIMRHDTDRRASFRFFLGRTTPGGVDIREVRLVRVGMKPEEIIPRDFPKPFADRMRRGITFGLALEAPYEGAWGPQLREEYFDRIRECGIFDHIRIPVRWNTHTLDSAPYTIDPEFMNRVDWAVSQGLNRGLYIVLNMHLFDELIANPSAYKKQFIAIWQQIAEYFKDYPDSLVFEIYNEPNKGLGENWNRYYLEVYDVIRQTNPTRTVVISCVDWANPDALGRLVLPERVRNDPNIMVQFHFYKPWEFCFQGSIGNSADDLRGRRWTGTDMQQRELARVADKVVAWSKRNGGVRLWNGEFCAHAGESREEDRLLWTAYIAKLCEERDIAWCYWDFGGDTAKLYDVDMNQWNKPMLEALTSNG